MGSQYRTINVRMPRPMADRFSRLAEEIPGLPQSVLLRMILEDYLDRDMSDQIGGILSRLTKQGQAKKLDNRDKTPDPLSRLGYRRINSKRPS